MRPFPSFAVLVAGIFQILGASAQSTAPSPVPLIAAPSPSLRTVSPELATKLSLNAPKFVAPKTTDTGQAPDLRETDKPANGIVRLPNYVVRDTKFRPLKERELLTPAGRLELAYKRHPGLRYSLPFFSNARVALDMLEAEERLQTITDLKDAAALVATRDKAAGAYIFREAEKTMMRTGDFGWRNSSNK